MFRARIMAPRVAPTPRVGRMRPALTGAAMVITYGTAPRSATPLAPLDLGVRRAGGRGFGRLRPTSGLARRLRPIIEQLVEIIVQFMNLNLSRANSTEGRLAVADAHRSLRRCGASNNTQ